MGKQIKHSIALDRKPADNICICKSWAEGSRVSAFSASVVICSGRTSNFEPSANYQLLFLFSSLASRA